MSIYTAQFWHIPPLEYSYQAGIAQRIDSKTKPPGSLGALETLAAKLALIQAQHNNGIEEIKIKAPHIVVFAGDHGIAQRNISIAPQAVTQQMVKNFLAGGAAINCFCHANNATLIVVDAGMVASVGEANNHYFIQPVAPGTQDISIHAAMTDPQCRQALSGGAAIAEKIIAKGANVIGFGEMGIANTSAASAMFSALTEYEAEDCVGAGTGIGAQQLKLKTTLVAKALNRVVIEHLDTELSPALIMQELGGFEIVQIVGAMLASAKAGIAILVDGFIVSVAALLAVRIAPNSLNYMVFAHQSHERAHGLVLETLNAQPLLKMDLRLGEGTGAALALPMLRAAAAFYNNMATFDSAKIEI